jgi:ferrous-iron efflux pump FieF
MATSKSNTSKVVLPSATIKLSIATGTLLMVVKFLTGFATNSMAVMASALDSAMDVAASSVNLFAANKSAEPPDKEHTYGHGKIESLAGLFQSLIISVSALYLACESIRRLVKGTHVENLSSGIGIMLFSIVVTCLLVWRLRAAAKKSGSIILETESLHFTTDLLSNTGVIFALLLIRFTGYLFWDLLVSLGIAAYILKAAYDIFQRSIDELLDRSLPPESCRQIKKLILAHNKAIVGIHNFRSRRAGGKIFLDFHIEIHGKDDFKQAHLMTEHLVAKIQDQYPGSDVTIHYDPEGEDERIRHAHFASRR